MKTETFFHFEPVDTAPSSTGMEQRMAAALACLFGLVFVFIESKNRFVRYCAVMSLFTWAAWMLSFLALGIVAWIPLIGLVFQVVQATLSLLALVIMGLMAWNAWRNKKLVVFRVSHFADEWSRPDSSDDGPPDIRSLPGPFEKP